MTSTVDTNLAPPGTSARVPARRKFRWSWRWLMHLVVIVFVVNWFVPILALFLSSIRTQSDAASSGWWMGLIQPLFTSYNYREALGESGITGSLATSLAIAIPVTVMTTVFSVIGAYALTRMRFAGRTALSLVLVAMMVAPPQITLVPLLRVYNLLGLSGTIPAIWIYQVGFTLPFGIFLLRGFIAGLPKELFESAAIDGASTLRIFRSIVIPLSLPIMISLALIQFLWSWDDLLTPLIFLGGSSVPAPISVELAGLAQQTSQGPGPLMAATFLSIVLPVGLVIALQRYFVRGIVAGAVKG